MNYLLYGTEDTLINNKINEIIKNNNIDEISITRYDYDINTLKDIIDDCQTVSLFSDKKLIIIDNTNIFNRTKKEDTDVEESEEKDNKSDKKLKILMDYLTNPNPDTILIFISKNSSIDNTKKITKLIKEKGYICEIDNKNISKIITDMFNGYKISNKDITLLINRVGNDIDILSKEIEKIKTYKIEDKEISEQDIIDCTSLNIDTDIYKFIDNIINRNKEEALNTYYELLKNNEEPYKIIALLASKFRLMYQVKYLSDKGLKKTQIAEQLGVKEYPVELALKSGLRYSDKTLLKYLISLADLDLDFKSTNVDTKLGFELFILKV